jgi:1,4-dihydroxy-2-naphthoate octaprenyltransferase
MVYRFEMFSTCRKPFGAILVFVLVGFIMFWVANDF